MAEYELTKLQLTIMNELWARGEATVLELQEALRPERGLAATTVATLMSRLVKKGLVAYRTEGRQYVYHALVDAGEVQRSMVADFAEMADRLFAGDLTQLVTHLLEERQADAAELARVREMIGRKERELEERS